MQYSILSRPIMTLDSGNKVYGDETSRSLMIDQCRILYFGDSPFSVVGKYDDIITISTSRRVQHVATDADGPILWKCFSDKIGYITIIITDSLITTAELFTDVITSSRCAIEDTGSVFGDDLVDMSY